jgi:hypothetical protein
MTQQLVEQIVQVYDKAITNLVNKALETAGVELNVELENKSRFKKLTASVEEGKTSVYYDNGTPEGLKLASYWFSTNKSLENPSIELKTEIEVKPKTQDNE